MSQESSSNRALRPRTLSLKAIENVQNDIINLSLEEEEQINSQRRRSTRLKKNANKKIIESGTDYDLATTSKRAQKPSTTENYNSSDAGSPADDDDDDDEESLFEEKQDLAGNDIFGFNTPKKKDGMLKKALQTPKSVTKTPKTKRKSRSDQHPQTPHHIRKHIKKEISKFVANDEESDDDESEKMDFSGDESDFVPESESESESDDDVEEGNIKERSESSSDDDLKSKRSPKRGSRKDNKDSYYLRKPSTCQKHLTADYVPESENYFNCHSKKDKARTSNNTLSRLKNPRLSVGEMVNLLDSMKLSAEHETAIVANLNEYKRNFHKWLFLLSEGFNILCYGLGSKRQLLLNFHKFLNDETVMVINGFFPSLTIKEILEGLLLEILGLKSFPADANDALDLFEAESNPASEIFLIVHNLDGPMLRNSKAQNVISRLAALPNIHLIASVDHINASLLWDHSKLRKFNFSWWDVTTMLPYTDETAFEKSLMVQNSGKHELSSMRNVYSALTSNGRGIYIILVKHQLKNKEISNYQGIPFRDLYMKCRESFLVSSDLALRVQLTEFLDHKLIKTKRHSDGTELLSIPIESSVLQQFVDELKE